MPAACNRLCLSLTSLLVGQISCHESVCSAVSGPTLPSPRPNPKRGVPVRSCGHGLAFHARPRALDLDPVAPVPLGLVQRIVSAKNASASWSA
jgi:hypothetical protein